MITVDDRPHMALKTVFKGPTDHTGARIIVTVLGSGARHTVMWDHRFGAPDNHARAAKIVAEERRSGWDGTLHMASVKNGGYVFVLV